MKHRAAATQGKVSVMAVVSASLQFLPWRLRHHKRMALKGDVWKQSLQSTYQWRGIYGHGLWTCFHFDGLWNLISMQIGKGVSQSADLKDCLSISCVTNIWEAGQCPRTLKEFWYHKERPMCCDETIWCPGKQTSWLRGRDDLSCPVALQQFCSQKSVVLEKTYYWLIC